MEATGETEAGDDTEAGEAIGDETEAGEATADDTEAGEATGDETEAGEAAALAEHLSSSVTASTISTRAVDSNSSALTPLETEGPSCDEGLPHLW